jgi:hypothetical protein
MVNLNADINYKKDNCVVPDILLETILITENEKKYPFYIRTNSDSTLNIFNAVINKFPHRKTKDKMLIDCLSKDNCMAIAGILIDNKVSNLDLGLFQVNYPSYPDKLEKYFDSESSYQKACSVVVDKINIKKRWNWDVFAGYHSFTKEFNNVYKKKLEENFKSLLLAKNLSPDTKLPSVSIDGVIEQSEINNSRLALNTVSEKRGVLKREVEYLSLIKD